MTDTAGSATEKMWKRLGGSMYHLGSVTWLHPHTPGAGGGRPRPLAASAGAGGCHWPGPCADRWTPRTPAPSTGGTGDAEKLAEEALSPRLLIDHLRLGPQRFDLWPEYDAESARPAVRPDRPVPGQRAAREEAWSGTSRGQPVGWYIASLLPSGIYRVLRPCGSAQATRSALLRHVLRRARDLGAAAVAGRVEPWLLEVFPTAHADVLALCGSSSIRAMRPSVMRFAPAKALLTGLESDIWLPR